MVRDADIEGKNISVSYLFKNGPKNLQVERTQLQNKKQASTIAWAFDLSVVVGFLQVPWDVDKSMSTFFLYRYLIGNLFF